MIKNWTRYEDIREKRDGYYVEYSPVFTGQEFAILTINFYENGFQDKVKEITEHEFNIWVNRYKTPIMIMLRNDTKEDWNTKKLTGQDYLLGYPNKKENFFCWGPYPKNKEPKIDLNPDYLADVYSEVPFKTSEDAQKKIRERVIGNRVLLILFTLWISVIPALIAFYGWANPTVSLIALIYSLYVALDKGLKLWGVKKKPQKEIDKEEENNKKDHHHYHCTLNPEGFIKLRAENFSKSIAEKKQKKIESLNN